MPTKPIDRKLKKRENKAKGTKVSKQAHKTPVPAHSSVGLKQPKKMKNKTSVARRVLSLSIVAYLGYNFLLGCGSPLDQNSQKPAVCEAIDPIKLDLMALYQSEFYQYKVHPHLLPVLNTATDYYDQYGAPQQAKLVHLYNQHGKPVLNKAHVMYQDRLLPTLLPYLDTCKIYLDQAKIYADPYVAKATQKALLAQEAIEYQWHHTLPPHVQRACDATFHTVKEWYERAEQTDMVPILLDFYWHLVDFMQYQFWPAIQSSHVTHKLKSEYDQYLKQYVDQHLKPVWVKYNDQVHLDQWLAHVLAVLPQRTIQQATSGSLMAQTKTSTVPTTTQDIPITQKVVSQPTLAETIGINHDEDIVKETSVASATKAVVTENHVVPVPEEKELFEQNPVPPQSPTHFDAQGKEDVLEQKVIKPVKENVEAVKENANTEKQVVEEKVEEAKKAADENIVKPLKQAKEQVMDHVEEAKDAAKVKMEDVKEIMEDRVVDIKQTVEENTNEAKKQVKELKEVAEDKAEEVKENAQENAKKAKDSVIDVKDYAEENIKEAAKDVKENIQENIKKAKDTTMDEKDHAEEDFKEAKEALEEKVEDTKESVKKDIQEAKNMVEDKVADAKDKAENVKEETVEEKAKDINKAQEINDKAVHLKQAAKVNEAKDTIEPEVMKPIEFDLKKPIEEYVKEPIQKVLKKPKQQQEVKFEGKEPQPKEQDASLLTKEQVVVSDDSSFVVQKEQPIAKDIPPIVIDQFVLEDEDEVVIDNEPIVPDDKSQFVKQ